MSFLQTEVISHTRRVCSLYKRGLRNLEAWYDRRPMYRYRAVLLRARFDENKDVKDMRVAQQLIEGGEKELFSLQHYQPRQFPLSPGGVSHGRVVDAPDWVLDYWHPMEKAAYPEYFARREQRKKEYVEWWEKTYGKPFEHSH
ncbi:NADH dehydrogenase [ubiquinone] 1 beta subcomplex subunit 9-like [Homarus americanus]|uniref:NADH dehydrogenase [ubiquinone] 1 beta subcomplex subunit 9 n=1 Tax=Homarus americanus TaxID=6706 RepID=A0A8J5MPA5_HOMAM|nr:NADH dehydrogenase [ubiquinone] 1 beta subcomplex subunit 9-like [Homarus americanus]KAG7158719.1 NADH dehydrogenase [ubiquinone] 1 beta subcomplex subunit 9-like [Homarus americanus]